MSHSKPIAGMDASGYYVRGVQRGEYLADGRRSSLQALTAGRRVVYAVRMPDGVVKIGTTIDLANRLYGLHAELLGFVFGSHADEKDIHHRLRPYRARGREYFHPVPSVFAVVNAMRDEFNLPHLAA